MKFLQENRVLRGAAWVLFLAAVCTAAFLGQQFLFAYSYTWSGSWETTQAYQSMFENRQYQVRDALQYQEQLEREDLSYVDREQYTTLLRGVREALSGGYTNFRYELLSADGSQVLESNLEPGDRSLEGVSYGLLQVLEGTVTLSQTGVLNGEWGQTLLGSLSTNQNAAAQGGEETYILRCGVLPIGAAAVQDEFYALNALYNHYAANMGLYGGIALACAGVAVLLLAFLLWGAGRRASAEGAVLSWPDRVLTEAWVLLLGLGSFLFWVYCVEYSNNVYAVTLQADRDWLLFLAVTGTVAAGAWSALVAAFLRTLTVRLRLRALARTTLLCRVVSFLTRRIAAFFRELPFTWKTVLFFLAYLAVIWCADMAGDWNPLPGMLINMAMLLFLAWWAAGFWRVRKGAEIIAAGNLNHQIDASRLPGDLKRHAEVLNNISGGLTNAVNEQMKSERFKAELITNVSHDLKTPLTSIINYVNLLKTTQQADPKAQEYIEVLDRKSQRLKKLTEDLVEASKASTGALAVNREKIGLAQLLDQALGEYEERLESRRLTVVRTLPEGECYVYADGRHVWRVMDNLLCNCAKYALEGTRIYLELVRGKGSVSLSVKNISKEPLNVPPERLMERFVRGEEARTTEGSGLGLSIAKSLTELQGGTFELVVDGDLFKAIVTLPQAT